MTLIVNYSYVSKYTQRKRFNLNKRRYAVPKGVTFSANTYLINVYLYV